MGRDMLPVLYASFIATCPSWMQQMDAPCLAGRYSMWAAGCNLGVDVSCFCWTSCCTLQAVVRHTFLSKHLAESYEGCCWAVNCWVHRLLLDLLLVRRLRVALSFTRFFWDAPLINESEQPWHLLLKSALFSFSTCSCLFYFSILGPWHAALSLGRVSFVQSRKKTFDAWCGWTMLCWTPLLLPILPALLNVACCSLHSLQAHT